MKSNRSMRRKKKKKKKKKEHDKKMQQEGAEAIRPKDAATKKEKIAKFRRVTGETAEVASFYLEMSNYNFQQSFNIYTSEGTNDDVVSDGTQLVETISKAGIECPAEKASEIASKERDEEDTTTSNQARNVGGIFVEEQSKEDAANASSPLSSLPSTAEKGLRIRCCVCGVMTKPNSANMCLRCLAPEIDLTTSFGGDELDVFQCRTCKKYQNKNRIWMSCEWESREFLGLLLKRIKALKRLKLVDASFVYTEPHSRRVKVKCVVQKAIFGDATSFFRQSVVVTFRIRSKMCDACAKESSNASQTWVAVVQLRQRHAADRKNVLERLEEEIRLSEAHAEAIGIQSTGGGLDFFFPKNRYAKTFVDFVKKSVPCRSSTTRTLVGHDVKSNVHRFQYAHKLEVAPLSKFDLVLLSSDVASSLGLPPGAAIVVSVTRTVQIVHIPHKARHVRGAFVDLSSRSLWKYPLRPVLGPGTMTEFLVLDVVCAPKDNEEDSHPPDLTVVEVAPSSAVGDAEIGTFFCSTHLKVFVGDTVMGHHLSKCVLSERDEIEKSGILLPEVVLIRVSKKATVD
eukprot:g4437.t1